MMGGSWLGYVAVFFGCFLFIALIAVCTAALYVRARRRGELGGGRVRVVDLASEDRSDGA